MRQRSHRVLDRRLTFPGIAFLALVFGAPLLFLVWTSFGLPHFTLDNYVRFFTPGFVMLTVRTVLIAFVVMVVCVLVGLPVAYGIINGPRPWRVVLLVGIILPQVVSIIVLTFGWQVLLGRFGLITEFLRLVGIETGGFLESPVAVTLALVQVQLPMFVFPLLGVMRGLDKSVLRSSSSLGAGPAYHLLRVYLPLCRPGIEAGAVLSFVYGVGAFIAPAVLGGSGSSMLGSQIEWTVSQAADVGFAATQAIILGIIVFTAIALYQRLTGGSVRGVVDASSAGASAIGARPRSARLMDRVGRVMVPHRWFGHVARLIDRSGLSRFPLWMVPSALALVVLMLPLLVSIPVSFNPDRLLVFPPKGFSLRWYEEFFTEAWLQPLATSVIVGLLAAFIATVLTFLAAYGARRGGSARLTGFVGGLMIGPAVVPTIVSAVGLFGIAIRLGWNDSIGGIVVGHAMVIAPFAFIILSAGVQSVGDVTERSARSLGASRLTVYRRVVFPAFRGFLLTAFAVCFLTSFDEAAVSIFLSGLDVKTLPAKMFEAMLIQADPTIGVLGTLWIALALVGIAVYAVSRIIRRRAGGVRQARLGR